MRPVKRGGSPIIGDYADYDDAKTELISRIGSGWLGDENVASYCSYCERRISTNLAVEHIEPKDGPHGQPHLKGRWTNFLLACVNCNSTKGRKRVVLTDLLFPDRDNTFVAFEYRKDGTIHPTSKPQQPAYQLAMSTLQLTGLDQTVRTTHDANGKLIAEDRASQRMQTWGQALLARSDYETNPNCENIKRLIISNAVYSGFFSIWMAAFDGIPDMRNRLIDAFGGTRGSSCFDPVTTMPIQPGPNPDGLPAGSKV